MIKKMLAMLAVVSCAFGAWADATHISGTDFSTHGTGDFITGRDDSGAATESTYWYNGNTNDFSGTIVLGTNGTDHVLDFESNITNPVYRTIKGCFGADDPSDFSPTNIGKGLFVDTYVAFTPYLVNNDHAAPTKVTPQDKIMVWVRETEVEEGANITNLIVTAGYYDGFDAVSVSNYVATLDSAAVSALCNGGLQRLTIKAFDNITTEDGMYLMGFVVYINEQPVEIKDVGNVFDVGGSFARALKATPAIYYTSSSHKLFPSLTGWSNDPADSVLTSVGYAGVGQIGEVWFDDYDTSYPAFAGDGLDFEVVVGDGVTSFDYNGQTYTASTLFSVPLTTTSVLITNVVYESGWKHKSGTWYNGSTIVYNSVDGNNRGFGTFLFADGTTLAVNGFQANYLVGEAEYQTLFGITPTENGAIAAALAGGGTIKLTKDTIINEGAQKCIMLTSGQSLTIDLNGHTLRGMSDSASIVNNGSLTINDSSEGQTGKVLGCLVDNPDYDSGDPESEPFINNYAAIQIQASAVGTTLTAGTYELIHTNQSNNVILISGGKYLDAWGEDTTVQPTSFYLADFIQSGMTVTAWTQDPESELWYATVGDAPVVTTYPVTFSTNAVVVAEWTTNIAENAALGGAIPDVSGLSGSWDAPAPTAETIITQATNFNFAVTPPVVTYEVTFSTNNIAVAEYNTNIVAGATLPVDAIPAFTGGTWDLDPTNAVINAATNFNYTIPYTLTYVTAHGVTPDGATYTNGAPNFALAAAPTADGWQFGGWVIGSVTNEAGATFVVADHLEDTTATAVWTPVTYTLTYTTEHGDAPAAVSYTVESNNFALAAAPTADGWQFGGWVIGVTTNNAGATYVVADHLANTTATAVWAAIVPPAYFPQSDIDPSSPYAGRDGTPAKPFVIRNYADLVALRNGVANGTILHECFEQVADIDMDGQDPWTGIGAFEKVDAGLGAFEGSYDGGNHTIANVTFDQHEYNGIFASVVGGVIKNLTVDVDGFAATSAFGGAAIAGVAESCHLTNLVATGTIIGQNDTPCTHSAAGIAVRMQGTVAYACTNRCEIWSSKGKLGGIAAIGQPANAVAGHDYLTLCSNEGDLHNTKGTLSSTEGVGGLFGYLGYHNNGQKQHITFTDCRSIGTVYSAASSNSGSFAGNTADLNAGAIVLAGTNVTRDDMRVVYNSDANGSVTYGKSIGGGLVELCTYAAFETNNTFSTLKSELTPTFAFDAAGTIAFNTNVYKATAFAITCPEGFEVEDSMAGGIVTFTCAASTPVDPWAPEGGDHSPTAVSNKVAEVFGEAVAAKVHDYDTYTNMVAYLEGKGVTNPDALKEGGAYVTAAPYIYQSYMLGAGTLFTAEPVISITEVEQTSTTGTWGFTVKVTQGSSSAACAVAADKVKELVKTRTSLTTGDWAKPAAADVHAEVGTGNLVEVTVAYGDGASGFMKISD